MSLEQKLEESFKTASTLHKVGYIPQLTSTGLLENQSITNWHLTYPIRKKNILLVKDHYSFLFTLEDFQNEFSMFKGFFNAYYNLQFLQAEIFLTEIREKYPMVSMTKAILSAMKGNTTSLMTILKKKIPKYAYFFEMVSNYYNIEEILFNRPKDYVNFPEMFRQSNTQSILNYWDFLQNLVSPQDSPETMELTRKMFISLAMTINRNRNPIEIKKLIDGMKEILEYCIEEAEEIRENGTPTLQKRFFKNLELTGQEFKNTFIRIVTSQWASDTTKDIILDLFGSWNKEFGTKITNERFICLIFDALRYKNQVLAEKNTKLFFKIQNQFKSIFDELDQKYKCE